MQLDDGCRRLQRQTEVECLGRIEEFYGKHALGVEDDLVEFDGGVSAHGNEVFLVLARGDGVDRRWHGKAFAKTHHRCGRVLRNHESAVRAGISHQEVRQSAGTGDKAVDASLGDVGQFAHGYRQEVDGQRDGLSVEVACRDNEIFFGANGGVVGGGVDFDVDDRLNISDSVFHRTVHLWHATERIGVLDVGLDVGDELAALEQFAHASGSLYLSEMGAHGMHSMCEGFYATVEGIEAHRGNLVCPVAQSFGL